MIYRLIIRMFYIIHVTITIRHDLYFTGSELSIKLKFFIFLGGLGDALG